MNSTSPFPPMKVHFPHVQIPQCLFNFTHSIPLPQNKSPFALVSTYATIDFYVGGSGLREIWIRGKRLLYERNGLREMDVIPQTVITFFK